MTERNKIHVCSSPIDFAAKRLVAHFQRVHEASIALSGGRTPRELFTLLATLYCDRIRWDRLKIFQVDERGVPPTHEDSNWKQIQERLLDQVPGLKAFRMQAEKGEQGAAEYEAVLEAEIPKNEAGLPRLDLVLLGMGPDGHTASLFPGTKALEVFDRTVVWNEVPQLSTHRMTLTYPVLQSAGNRWFLLKGSDKAAMFKKVLEGEYPAGKLTDTEWFIDEDLAAVL